MREIPLILDERRAHISTGFIWSENKIYNEKISAYTRNNYLLELIDHIL